MIKHPLRVMITALALFWLFPLFGVTFSGSVLEAIGLSAVLTIFCSILHVVQEELNKEFNINIGGNGISVLAGMLSLGAYWLITYLLLPGLLLKLASLLLPGLLHISSYGAILGGGLVLFLIGLSTQAYAREDAGCAPCGNKKKKKPCCKGKKAHNQPIKPDAGLPAEDKSKDQVQPPEDIA